MSLVAALAIAATGFHPPLDRDLAYVISEDRTIAGATAHFESHRHLRFQAEGSGFLVTLRFDPAPPPKGNDAAALFQAAMARLADHVVRLHLDADGHVTAVDDTAGLWQAICDAIVALPGTAPARARAAQLADTLRTLPPAQQTAMLASMITPVIAGDDAALPAGTRPATIAARPPAAPGASIAGTQTVTRPPSGPIDIQLTASGDATDKTGAPLHLVIARDRRIDPAAGLVIASHDRTETTVGTDTLIADTRTKLTIPVS